MKPISIWSGLTRTLNFLGLVLVSLLISFFVFLLVSWKYQRTEAVQALNMKLEKYHHVEIDKDLTLLNIEADSERILATLQSKSGDNSAKMVLQAQSYLCQLVQKLPSSALFQDRSSFNIIAILDRSKLGLFEDQPEIITSYALNECDQIKKRPNLSGAF